MSVNTEALIEQGWEYIDEEAYDSASAVGTQLIGLGNEAGYRMMTQVYLAQDELEKALEILQAGTQVLPLEWKLWFQLGTLQSDLNEFEKAESSYETALACPEVEEAWIYINQGVLTYRQGKIEEALGILNSITDEEVSSEAFSLQLIILEQSNRYGEILELVKEKLEILRSPIDEQDAHTFSRICTTTAYACWHAGRSAEERLHYLYQALEYDRTNPEALWLLREAQPEYSEQALYYELLVQGNFSSKDSVENRGLMFLTTYAVVAENETEALEFIKDFESSEVDKESLRVLEADQREADSTDAKGIYAVGGFGWLEEDHE